MKNTILNFLKLTFALLLMLVSNKVSAQSFVSFTAGTSSTLSGTFTGGTLSITQTGTATKSQNIVSPGQTTALPSTSPLSQVGATTFRASSPSPDQQPKDLTFTFSQPVRVTKFNFFGLDAPTGTGAYTDQIKFSGISFATFTASTNAVITSTSVKPNTNASQQYGLFSNSNEVVSSFTINYPPDTSSLYPSVINYELEVVVCNAGSTAPTLSATTATNTCSTKTNLNVLVTSALPTGTSLVWFTNNTRTGTPYPLASAAGVGTFFGFYYDATNNCYSPASAAVTVTQAAPLPAPTVAANAGVITTCPATTANIVSQVTSTTPSGSSLVWYNNPLRTGTPITATAAPKGLYYAFYFNATTGCYSPASNPVFAAVTSCCTTIGNGVTVTATGTANAGYNVNQTTMTCPTTPFSGAASWTGLSATGTVVYTFSRPVLSAKIFYTAVNSDDIATITTNGGTALLSNPSCGLRISGTQIQGTVPSGDVFLTVSAASPFTTITVTNTSGTSGWVQGNFCDFEVTTCAAGTAAPTLSATTVSNTCPGTTNLNSLVTSATPAGATLVWFITATPTGTPYSRPTAAIPGTYYAFYFDALNNCYSPATAAVTATSTACTLTQASTCPNVSVDLTTRAPSTVPSGSTVTYHTGTPATSTNQITTAQAQAITTSGTYYVSFYDAVQACYAPTSWPLVVTITNCCATVSPLIWN